MKRTTAWVAHASPSSFQAFKTSLGTEFGVDRVQIQRHKIEGSDGDGVDLLPQLWNYLLNYEEDPKAPDAPPDPTPPPPLILLHYIPRPPDTWVLRLDYDPTGIPVQRLEDLVKSLVGAPRNSSSSSHVSPTTLAIHWCRGYASPSSDASSSFGWSTLSALSDYMLSWSQWTSSWMPGKHPPNAWVELGAEDSRGRKTGKKKGAQPQPTEGKSDPIPEDSSPPTFFYHRQHFPLSTELSLVSRFHCGFSSWLAVTLFQLLRMSFLHYHKISLARISGAINEAPLGGGGERQDSQSSNPPQYHVLDLDTHEDLSDALFQVERLSTNAPSSPTVPPHCMFVVQHRAPPDFWCSLGEPSSRDPAHPHLHHWTLPEKWNGTTTPCWVLEVSYTTYGALVVTHQFLGDALGEMQQALADAFEMEMRCSGGTGG